MTVLDTRDITAKQARTLFDVALGEFLFFAECAKAVTDNHWIYSSSGRYVVVHTAFYKSQICNDVKRTEGLAILERGPSEGAPRSAI